MGSVLAQLAVIHDSLVITLYRLLGMSQEQPLLHGFEALTRQEPTSCCCRSHHCEAVGSTLSFQSAYKKVHLW